MITANERAAMTESVGAAIADAVARSANVDATLAELGWRELLADDPDAAVEIVFTALGSANATASALDDVLAATLGFELGADLAILLPNFASWAPPGRIDGSHSHAHGIATCRAATAAEILVACDNESALNTSMVSVAAAEVTVVRGVDPDAGLHFVRCPIETKGGRPLDPAAWQSALALGRRAVAYQIAGACRTVLNLARTHALDRMQFGRPIARFQAVRHKLAEVLVAVESLDAALAAAGDTPSPETAALAKAIAGRTAYTTAKHCQQVLAGIGFTTEHQFHRYLKRILAFEGLFGSADAITHDIGHRLLAERRVPTLIEL